MPKTDDAFAGMLGVECAAIDLEGNVRSQVTVKLEVRDEVASPKARSNPPALTVGGGP